MLKLVEHPRSEVVDEVFEKNIEDRNDNDMMILVNYCENNKFFKSLSFPVIEQIAHVVRRQNYQVGYWSWFVVLTRVVIRCLEITRLYLPQMHRANSIGILTIFASALFHFPPRFASSIHAASVSFPHTHNLFPSIIF